MYRILTLCLLLLCCTVDPIESSKLIVIITFDDAHVSIYNTAFLLMRQYDPNWTATHFLCNTYSPGYPLVSIEQLKEMERAGWETGGHGYSHENFSSLPLDSIRSQVKLSHDFLVNNGLSHESFAYPFGNFNDSVQAIVEKYFTNIRTSHDYHYPYVNRKNLGYFAVKAEQNGDNIIARIEEAEANREKVVVIGFHLILPDTSAPSSMYWCNESAFRKFLSYLKAKEMNVYSIRDAMAVLYK